MKPKQILLRILGGIIFMAGTVWFYLLTNKQTLLALLIILLGIETIHLGMKDHSPK
jgi:hypothetical protein